jgi:hypothetical protein
MADGYGKWPMVMAMSLDSPSTMTISHQPLAIDD